MSFFESIKEQASSAVKSTSEMIEISRLNRQINNMEEDIEHILSNIGKLLFQSYVNGSQVEPEMEQKCLAVKESLQQIDELKLRILGLKDKKLCINCSAELNIVDLYCSRCGAKQPEIKQEEAENPETEETHGDGETQDNDHTHENVENPEAREQED